MNAPFDDDYAIVCGMPRCGTRQFTDFLNNHPNVCIQDEIGEIVLKRACELVLLADKVYLDSSARNSYLAKRRTVVAQLLGLFTKGRIRFKEGSVVNGFKTPNVELHGLTLNAVFAPSFARLHYLYCIRNLRDCYLSLTAMPWFRLTRSEYASRYMASLSTAMDLRQASMSADEPRFDIHILNLDAFVASENRGDWIRDCLFARAGATISDEVAADIVARTRNANSTKNKFGRKRPTTFSADDAKYFGERRTEIEEVVARFNETFGSCLVTEIE